MHDPLLAFAPGDAAARPDRPRAGLRRGESWFLAMCHLDDGAAAAAACADPVWADVIRTAEALEAVPTLAATAVAAGLIPDLPLGAVERVAEPGRAGLSWSAVLLLARARNIARTADLREQGTEILDAFAQAGLRAAPLKGLHLLREGVWPDPAARPMRDLDVLVAPEDLDRARHILRTLGYVAADGPTGYGRLADDHHDPALHRPGRAGTVELHRSLLARDHADQLETAGVLDRITDGRLDPTDVLLHLAAHAQLQDGGRWMARVPLRAVLDSAWLLRRYGPPDPEVVRERCGPALRRALARQLHDVALVAARARRIDTLRWEAACRLARSPALSGAYRDLCYAPRTLAAGRIAQLYDVPPHGLPLAGARAHYAASAFLRRRGAARGAPGVR